MMRAFILVIILFSFTLGANDFEKELKKKINFNNSNNKKSVIVFDLDNVLLDSSSRVSFLLKKYLKKHYIKSLYKYLKDKGENIEFQDFKNDLNELKISDKSKEKLMKYLSENYNSTEAFKKDKAMKNSVDFVKKLYNKNCFILYVTSKKIDYLPLFVEKLNNLSFPIGVNSTSIIMDVNADNIRNILSSWDEMGDVTAFFSADLEKIKKLKPYFKSSFLYFISLKNKLNAEGYQVLSGF